jgi:small subunit ribosomal protein S20
VAHSLSAKKRVRQSIKRRARNRYRKEVVKDTVKGFTTALSSGDLSKAAAVFKDVVKRLDKVAAKGTIHKKTASRKRSRMAKKLNAAQKGGPKPATTKTGGKGRSAKTSA